MTDFVVDVLYYMGVLGIGFGVLVVLVCLASGVKHVE